MAISFVWSKSMNFAFCLLAFSLSSSCQLDRSSSVETRAQNAEAKEPLPGVYDFAKLTTLLKDSRVAIVTNHTGTIGKTHIVDTLLAVDVDVVRVFAPEHGFRGDVPDGEDISSGVDPSTGLRIISLYGNKKKPSPKDLGDVDVVLFDIQDVGARFYTYLSTLHYVIQACSENDIPLIIADRPNPNIHYTDGPILEPEHSSFVGLHPVPIVYGMTIGEYGMMINGEHWHGDKNCRITVLPCLNYSRATTYTLPIYPSPNLNSMEAVYLYPSICLFEGTVVSVGRGTDFPFTVIGEPSNKSGNFEFIPISKAGASMNPKHKGEKCVGYNLLTHYKQFSSFGELDLSWLEKMYEETGNKESFFLRSGYFEKLAGTTQIRDHLLAGKSLDALRKTWKEDLSSFEKLRKPYLIYE
jgi:uncharacterized protein YbbC (DUF1343 family)